MLEIYTQLKNLNVGDLHSTQEPSTKIDILNTPNQTNLKPHEKELLEETCCEMCMLAIDRGATYMRAMLFLSSLKGCLSSNVVCSRPRQGGQQEETTLQFLTLQ